MSRILRIAICTTILVLGAGMASAHHVNCSRDIDNDGKENSNDTRIIDAAMGSKIGAPSYDERADLDQNGVVNKADRSAYKHCTPLALERYRSRAR